MNLLAILEMAEEIMRGTKGLIEALQKHPEVKAARAKQPKTPPTPAPSPTPAANPTDPKH